MYISSSLLERGLAEAQVEEIVRVSVLRNRSLGVTGALLFTGDRFAQYIEGDGPAVEEVRSCIMRDSRHSGITTLQAGPHPHRHFLTWALAYAGPSQFVASIVDDALDAALAGGGKSVDDLVELLSEFSIGGRG